MSSIGANVGLQFLFSSLGLATSSLVLARDRLWKWLDAVDVYSSGNLQQIRNFNNSLANPDSQWYSAWLELGMAWYVGFASIWLLSVFLLCATLKWPVPLLAVPNVAISVMGVFANLALFGAILAWLLELPNDLRTDGHEQKMLIGASGFFGICAIFSLIFTGLSSHHYNTLKKIMRARNRQITPDSPSSLDQQRMDARKKEAAEFYKT